MGHREEDRDMHNEEGMWLWGMGRMIERGIENRGCSYGAKEGQQGREQGTGNVVMEQREEDREGCREGGMWL